MSDEQENLSVETPTQPKRAYKKRKAAKKPRQHPGVIETIAPKYTARNEGTAQVTGRRYCCELQSRHADWLEAVARQEGRSPENMLERLVRLGYAADPYKGKGPQAGQTEAGGFSGRKEDLPGG